MLGSQLVVTVADHAPNFDVAPTCRQSSVPNCLNMEKIARDKLIKDWPTFTTQDKTMCLMEEKNAGRPSYVGWLTCLGIDAMHEARRQKEQTAMLPQVEQGSRPWLIGALVSRNR
jgi:hypothetical protein